ncbi:MAG: hypothetical protein JO159_00875 [Acidobacteria bacterium]|nr:hypothetical protein [Acidobacteriota bacterium]MBV9624748.1 hypothetical protein [Acidobacteriota bacterium]
MPTGDINHFGEIALKAAACRAVETELDDGFVRDAFAARPGGELGLSITFPQSTMVHFGIAFVDELLLEPPATYPVRTVLNVGCGLETPPGHSILPGICVGSKSISPAYSIGPAHVRRDIPIS